MSNFLKVYMAIKLSSMMIEYWNNKKKLITNAIFAFDDYSMKPSLLWLW